MSPSIRVLHVLHDLSGGGAERLVLDLCRHRSREVDTRVAVLRKGGELESAFRSEGVSVLCAGGRKLGTGPRAIARLRRWSHEADVVHTHLWSGDFWGGLAARLAERPLVSTVHNTRGDGPLRDWLLRHCVVPQVVVGVSPAACKMVETFGTAGRQIRCIPNGVDLQRFQASQWTAGPPWRLLMVGRLTEQKGIDRLIRALEGVDGVSLDLVGQGEELAALQSLASELGVSVHFQGWRRDVGTAYAESHALVLPSRWEGFGLVAVEAMACGRPVISTAVDGLDEVLGDVGIRVLGDEIQDLRTAIIDALSQPDGLRKRGEAGPEQAARFSIQRTVEAYESLYRELAGRRVQA